jgi:hypothetical protein
MAFYEHLPSIIPYVTELFYLRNTNFIDIIVYEIHIIIISVVIIGSCSC